MASVVPAGAADFISQPSAETVDMTGGSDVSASGMSEGDLSGDDTSDTEPGSRQDGTDVPPEQGMPAPDTDQPETPDTDQENPVGDGQDTDIFTEPPQEPADPSGDIDLFTSGAVETEPSQEPVMGVSATLVEVNKDDWEEAENGGFKLRKSAGVYYTSADGVVYIKTVKNKDAASSDTAAHLGYAGYYFFDEQGIMVTGQKTISDSLLNKASSVLTNSVPSDNADGTEPVQTDMPADGTAQAEEVYSAEEPAAEMVFGSGDVSLPDDGSVVNNTDMAGETIQGGDETDNNIPADSTVPGDESIPGDDPAGQVPGSDDAPAADDTDGTVETPAADDETPVYNTGDEKEFYFTDSTTAVLYEGETGTKFTPANSDLGQMKKKYWLWTGTAFRYYDSSGKFLSVDELKNINIAQNKYTGYYGIDGSYYCLDTNGVPQVGDITLSGVKNPGKYYFQETAGENGIKGAMQRSSWRCKDTAKGSQWLYYKSNGVLYERGMVATKLDTEVMGNYTYLLSSDGYIQKSVMKKAANGAYYGTDKYGRVYKEKLVKFGTARYYFGSNGKRVTWTKVWRRCKGASNRFYYFGSTPGKVAEKTGWQKVTSNTGKMYGWFYFSSTGNHYINKWAQGGYFKENGQLASGVTEVDGKTYFFQVSNSTTHRGKLFKSTWISYKNKWYYAQSNGVLYKSGWKKIDGNYYYFQGDFTTKTNAFVKRGSVNGYVDNKGKFCTGWVITSNANNQVKYVNPDGSGFIKNTSKVIDGLRYYFDKNGYRKNDLTSVYRGPYYVEVDRVNGVMTIFDSGRTVPVKTIRVSVGLPGTSTPTGTYYLSRSGRWQPLMGPSWGQYGTHVVGAGQGGIFVHSVASPLANAYNLPVGEYNKLGNPASHGCIRTCVADAKWVYENCNGARIKIFDGTYKADEALKGPLGRRALVKYVGGGYDPTDPSV